jgi:hypothetical protein
VVFHSLRCCFGSVACGADVDVGVRVGCGYHVGGGKRVRSREVGCWGGGRAGGTLRRHRRVVMVGYWSRWLGVVGWRGGGFTVVLVRSGCGRCITYRRLGAGILIRSRGRCAWVSVRDGSRRAARRAGRRTRNIASR